MSLHAIFLSQFKPPQHELKGPSCNLIDDIRQDYWLGVKIKITFEVRNLSKRYNRLLNKGAVVALYGAVMIPFPAQASTTRLDPILPAPAIISSKPLPKLKEPSYKLVEPLETIFVSKLRDFGTYANSFYTGQCTQYVASRLPVTWSGNANEWAANAAAQGYIVSAIPKVGSIAQNITDSYLGHVGITAQIEGGMVRLEEQNYAGPGVITTDRWAPIGAYVYIYV